MRFGEVRRSRSTSLERPHRHLGPGHPRAAPRQTSHTRQVTVRQATPGIVNVLDAPLIPTSPAAGGRPTGTKTAAASTDPLHLIWAAHAAGLRSVKRGSARDGPSPKIHELVCRILWSWGRHYMKTPGLLRDQVAATLDTRSISLAPANAVLRLGVGDRQWRTVEPSGKRRPAHPRRQQRSPSLFSREPNLMRLLSRSTCTASRIP
jgi:hypothetical protein